MSTQGFTKKPSANPAPASSAFAPKTPAQSAPAAGAQSGGGGGDGRVEMKLNADAVRRRAYELYAKRTAEGKPGDDKSDWAQAERELRK